MVVAGEAPLSPARSRLLILECSQSPLILAVQAACARRQTAAAHSITSCEAEVVHSHVELGGARLDRGAAAASCFQQHTVLSPWKTCSMCGSREAQAMHGHLQLGGPQLDKEAADASCLRQRNIRVPCRCRPASQVGIRRYSAGHGSCCGFLLAITCYFYTHWLACLVNREASTAWVRTQCAVSLVMSGCSRPKAPVHLHYPLD